MVSDQSFLGSRSEVKAEAEGVFDRRVKELAAELGHEPSQLELAEHFVTTNKEMSFGPKGVEDTGEFHSDVTCSDNSDTLGLLFQGEEAIRVDTE